MAERIESVRVMPLREVPGGGHIGVTRVGALPMPTLGDTPPPSDAFGSHSYMSPLPWEAPRHSVLIASEAW